MRFYIPFLTVLLIFQTSSGDKLFQMKIGPTWPSSLWDTEKPTAWDASIQTGGVFDDKVAIGCAVDFLWNNDAKEKKYASGIYKVEMLQRTFMFPVAGFVSVSPLSELAVHPCISGFIGLNTMYFSYKGDRDTIPRTIKIDGSGWYMGLIWKIAGDCEIKMGQSSSFITGMEYQWSKPRKLEDENEDLYLRRNMSGFGIRLGIKVYY